MEKNQDKEKVWDVDVYRIVTTTHTERSVIAVRARSEDEARQRIQENERTIEQLCDHAESAWHDQGDYDTEYGDYNLCSVRPHELVHECQEPTERSEDVRLALESLRSVGGKLAADDLHELATLLFQAWHAQQEVVQVERPPVTDVEIDGEAFQQALSALESTGDNRRPAGRSPGVPLSVIFLDTQNEQRARQIRSALHMLTDDELGEVRDSLGYIMERRQRESCHLRWYSLGGDSVPIWRSYCDDYWIVEHDKADYHALGQDKRDLGRHASLESAFAECERRYQAKLGESRA